MFSEKHNYHSNIIFVSGLLSVNQLVTSALLSLKDTQGIFDEHDLAWDVQVEAQIGMLAELSTPCLCFSSQNTSFPGAFLLLEEKQ